MDNINPAGTTGLQPISLPESSPQQSNAPIATDLDKARSAPASTSITAYSSSPLPDWAYSTWAAMHESQDGRTYRHLVGKLADERNCDPNDISVELLKNIHRLESSVRFGAFNALTNSRPIDDRFLAIGTDEWLKNFAEKDRIEVLDALDRMVIHV
ncbi:hypothetical protein AB870_11580 [Pandoraea faecigallinarum]|uniref:Uncharacterized protein n=1 Tax=Pandoraea faecigallinarum TaxID=656179 RepID=A0A0H3WVQ0_9BURK|nr:hypothetical protein [Pandoraea faecigallinarum]AKM30611.1 hypothetical protein AB870_11580 [Pandoraea faecigallinarum]